MAIDGAIKTVQIKEQERTRGFSVDSPVSGAYELHIRRQMIDKNTGTQLGDELAVVTLTLAQMLAYPKVAALLASIPPIIDEVVVAERARIAAEAQADAAVEAATVKARVDEAKARVAADKAEADALIASREAAAQAVIRQRADAKLAADALAAAKLAGV